MVRRKGNTDAGAERERITKMKALATDMAKYLIISVMVISEGPVGLS